MKKREQDPTSFDYNISQLTILTSKSEVTFESSYSEVRKTNIHDVISRKYLIGNIYSFYFSGETTTGPLFYTSRSYGATRRLRRLQDKGVTFYFLVILDLLFVSIGPDKIQGIADSRSSRETKEDSSYMILVLENLTYFGARGSSCPCFKTWHV